MRKRLANFFRKKWKWLVVPTLVGSLLLVAGAGAYMYHRITSLEGELHEVEGEQLERKLEDLRDEESEKESEDEPPQQYVPEPPPPTYSQPELEQIIGEVWDYVWGTPPTPENFEWAKNKMLSENWSRYDLQDYLMKTPEFQQAYCGIPENMSPQDYREGFSTLNAVWLSSRGRELTKEEYARILRGETIPPEFEFTTRTEF